jgi:hypothetical protein
MADPDGRSGGAPGSSLSAVLVRRGASPSRVVPETPRDAGAAGAHGGGGEAFPTRDQRLGR